MIRKTEGIILRNVKYGETSVIVTIFTRVFGVQSYIVNGVRSVSKKSGSSKATFFQPAAILDLVVYHQEHVQLHRIRDFQWRFLYKNIFTDVHKHSVAVFMIELLTKCLKQPEAAEDLYAFMEDCLQELDASSARQTANFPLFFAVQLPVFFGFGIQGQYSEASLWLNLEEGCFTASAPTSGYPVAETESHAVSELLLVRQISELQEIHLQQEHRRKILQAMEMYFVLHVPDFGQLRTLAVLRELMN